jgi:Arc/MetJ family transcription regulator
MLVRTNIEIDVDLLEEARQVSSLKTKKEIVFRALEEFVARRKRAGLLDIRRQGLWEGNLDEMRASRLDTH